MKPKFVIGNQIIWKERSANSTRLVGMITNINDKDYLIQWDDGYSAYYPFKYDRNFMLAYGYQDFLEKINERMK